MSILSRTTLCPVLICLLWVSCTTGESLPKLEIYLTDVYPLHYADKNSGEPKGSLLEHVSVYLDASEYSYTFHFVGWSNAVFEAARSGNALIMPLSRTKGREDKFHWLYETGSSYFSIYGNRKLSFNQVMAQAQQRKVMVFCERLSISCSLINQAGIPTSITDSYHTSNFFEVVRMALDGKADYIVVENHRIEEFFRQHPEVENTLHNVHTFPEPLRDYIAISRYADPEIIKRLLETARRLQQGQ